ncbi:metal-sensing transcriptional repressor [Metabacillus halosaccharovorans]|nr:metal-sensing transcriptional repressor [Metabacillus halosaccharovorans]
MEAQVRGIKGLIEKDTYCDVVLTHISATQAAINLEVLDVVLITFQKLMKK